MTVARMQRIMVEADLGLPAVSHTAEELAFRTEVERGLKEAHARGQRLEFEPGEWDPDFD